MTHGTQKFNVVQQNISATSPEIKNKRWMNQKPQMCWKCQKDKSMLGGSLKFFGTVRRFICVDCVFAKYAAIDKATGDAK
jgi:hypothetical protein